MTSYNQADSLAEAIQSVLDQTYQDFEILVVDDGSTDASFSVVQESCDDKLVALRHDVNQGYGASLIDGFQYAVENNYE